MEDANSLRRVLREIESVVFSDLCEELEIKAANGKLRGEKLQMQKMLSKVYRLAHAYNSDHSCFRSHADWRQELLTNPIPEM